MTDIGPGIGEQVLAVKPGGREVMIDVVEAVSYERAKIGWRIKWPGDTEPAKEKAKAAAYAKVRELQRKHAAAPKRRPAAAVAPATPAGTGGGDA